MLKKMMYFSFLSFIGNFAFAEIEQAQYRLVPEYETSRAVVLAPELSRPYINESQTNNLALHKERLGLISMITENSPEVLVYLLQKASGPNADSNEWLKRLGGQVRLLTKASSEIDPWVRDNGPWSIQSGSGPLLLDVNEEGRNNVSQQFLEIPNSSVIATKDFGGMPGGNIMTDSSGRCYSTQLPLANANNRLNPFCREFILLPKLPNEITTHVDLFAKIVNSSTVVISSFPNRVRIAKCTNSQNPSNSDCKNTEKFESIILDVKKDSNGEPVEMSPPELQTYLSENYDVSNSYMEDGCCSTPLSKWQAPDWEGYASRVADIFLKLGFRVVMLKSPPPILRISTDGHGPAQFRFVFRSYANSTILNDHVYVPVYLTEKQEINKEALAAYKNIGLTPIAVPSDYNIEARGAVHCLTMGVH